MSNQKIEGNLEVLNGVKFAGGGRLTAKNLKL